MVGSQRYRLAAFELQTTDAKVIDVAMKYGYDSPEAFARAFKNLHGIMPISARDKGVPLKAYPRMSFHISIKGDVEMNYRIEQRGSFEMFGVYGLVNTDQKTAFSEVPQFRKKCDDDGSVDLMNDLLGVLVTPCYTPPYTITLENLSNTWSVTIYLRDLKFRRDLQNFLSRH